MSTSQILSYIFTTSKAIAKRHGIKIILLGLLSRMLGQGIIRFFDAQLGIGEIILNLEKNIKMKLPSLLIESGGNIDGMVLRETMYGDAWESLKPHLHTILLIGLGSALISSLIFILIVKFSSQHIQNQDISTSSTLGESFKILLPYLGTKILKRIVLALGFSLFIVPGLILSVYFMFTDYVAIDQKKYFIAALKESWRIVKHRWAQTTWIGFLIGLLSGIGILLLVSIAGFVFGLIPDTAIQTGLLSMVIIVASFFVQILIVVFYKKRLNSKSEN